MPPFTLDFLDHVAIRVADIQASAAWYEKVLGLRRVQLPEWNPFPIMMLAGKTGIALFPANIDDPKLDVSSRNVKIDHFAFQVSNESFEAAQKWFSKINVPFEWQDHQAFHSVYLTDPDGHRVELTTLVQDGKSIYG